MTIADACGADASTAAVTTAATTTTFFSMGNLPAYTGLPGPPRPAQ